MGLVLASDRENLKTAIAFHLHITPEAAEFGSKRRSRFGCALWRASGACWRMPARARAGTLKDGVICGCFCFFRRQPHCTEPRRRRRGGGSETGERPALSAVWATPGQRRRRAAKRSTTTWARPLPRAERTGRSRSGRRGSVWKTPRTRTLAAFMESLRCGRAIGRKRPRR